MRSIYSKIFRSFISALIFVSLYSIELNAQVFQTLDYDTLAGAQAEKTYAVELNNDHYVDLIHIVKNEHDYKGLIYLQVDSLAFELSDTILNLASPVMEMTDINNSGQIDLLIDEIENEQHQLVALLDYNGLDGFNRSVIASTDSILQVQYSDFEHDGLKDLYVISHLAGKNHLSKIRQSEPLSFQIDTVFQEVDLILQLSVNNDGWADLAVYNQVENMINFLLPDPDDPSKWDSISVEVDFKIKEWVITDAFPDGRTDIIACSDENGVSSLYLISNFQPEFQIDKIWKGDNLDFFTSADINNDGYYDVVMSENGRQMLLSKLPESTTFESQTLEISDTLKIIQIGDIDENGILDLIGSKIGSDTIVYSYVLNYTHESNTGPFYTPIDIPITIGNQTYFSWGFPVDDKTFSNSLTYDFYLKIREEENFLFTSNADLENPKRNGFRNIKRHGDLLFDPQYTVQDLPNGIFEWGVIGVDNSFHSSTDITNCNGGAGNQNCVDYYVTNCLELTTENTFSCINDTLNLSIGEPGDSIAWYSKKQGLLGTDNSIQFIVAEDDTVYAVAVPKIPCEEISEACIKNYSLSIETSENKDLVESDFYLCQDSSQTITLEGNYEEILWYTDTQILSENDSVTFDSSIGPILFLKARELDNTCFMFDTLSLMPIDSIEINLFAKETDLACINSYYHPEISLPDSLNEKTTYNIFINGQVIVNEEYLISVPTTFVAKGYFENCHVFTDTLVVSPKSPPTISVTGETRVFPGKETRLTASGAQSYQWTPSVYLSDPHSASNIVRPTHSVDYQITGWDEDGCEGSTSVRVEVIPSVYVPELFTPNDDGNNDKLLVYRNSGNSLENFNFAIYDGNGRKVYSTSSVSEITQYGWDGTKNGSKVAPGSYLWVIEGNFTNGTPITSEGKTKGEIKIVR